VNHKGELNAEIGKINSTMLVDEGGGKFKIFF
jgi:hypothetical protein